MVVFSKPKEGRFYNIWARHDFALIEDNGRIVRPSPVELRSLVAVRYAEVHGRNVPYRRLRVTR